MSFATVVLLDRWPQPSTSPDPVVFATDTQLCLRYCTAEEEIAVIHFPLVKKIQFGSPNDEALGGHRHGVSQGDRGVRCGAAALCLSVRQPPRQSHESAGAWVHGEKL